MTTDRWGRPLPDSSEPRFLCPDGCGKHLTAAQMQEHQADPHYAWRHRTGNYEEE